MLAASNAVSTGEIAFLSDLTEQEINRLAGDNVFPAELVMQRRGWRFAPLAAVFAQFYVQANEKLTRSAQIQVIAMLTDRVLKHSDSKIFLLLAGRAESAKFDWSVAYSADTVDLAPYVDEVTGRAERLRRATRQVKEDPGILGGSPCFKGTRVPIANVLAIVDSGMPFDELRSAYPFLTMDLVEDARIYAKIRPYVAQPRRIERVLPGATLVHSKVVRLR